VTPRSVAIPLLLTLLVTTPLGAQPEGVAGTLHNLSTSGPGEVRSLTESEVCKFCHIPHNAAAPDALWSRRIPKTEYQTPELRRGRPDAQPAPQPDGASRLCLSCHDGTIALGDLASESRPIAMTRGDSLRPGDRGFLGTDLSGSHPISFVVPDARTTAAEDSDMGLRPLEALGASSGVRLDGDRKMQCTTCHDAHSDRHYSPGRTPHFWVRPTVQEVCVACHVPR